MIDEAAHQGVTRAELERAELKRRAASQHDGALSPISPMAVDNATIGYQMLMDPKAFATLERMAENAAKSGLKGAPRKEVALTKILVGLELGIGAMRAVTLVDIIDGDIAIRGKLALALIQERALPLGATCDWSEWTEEKCVWSMGRPGREPKLYEFTVEDARRAQLIREDGESKKQNWNRWLKDMLMWRAFAKGAKIEFQQILQGCYIYEELEHHVDDRRVRGQQQHPQRTGTRTIRPRSGAASGPSVPPSEPARAPGRQDDAPTAPASDGAQASNHRHEVAEKTDAEPQVERGNHQDPELVERWLAEVGFRVAGSSDAQRTPEVGPAIATAPAEPPPQPTSEPAPQPEPWQAQAKKDFLSWADLTFRQTEPRDEMSRPVKPARWRSYKWTEVCKEVLGLEQPLPIVQLDQAQCDLLSSTMRDRLVEAAASGGGSSSVSA